MWSPRSNRLIIYGVATHRYQVSPRDRVSVAATFSFAFRFQICDAWPGTTTAMTTPALRSTSASCATVISKPSIALSASALYRVGPILPQPFDYHAPLAHRNHHPASVVTFLSTRHQPLRRSCPIESTPPTSLVPASSPCPPPEITSPTQPRPLPSKPELSHRLVSLHAKLQTPSGPNAFTLRLPVPSNLNIPEWRRRLTAYPDRVICEFLEFGWPVGYSSPSPPSSSSRNHGSARAQPNIVQSYLDQSHVRCRSHVRPLHVQPALHTPHRFSSPDRPEPLRQISACRRPRLPPRDIR